MKYNYKIAQKRISGGGGNVLVQGGRYLICFTFFYHDESPFGECFFKPL